MRSLRIAIAAVLLSSSACAALPYSGVALEAYGGVTRMTPADDAAMEAEQGTGTQVGLALSLEVDYIRSSGMGAGYAYVRSSLPRTGGASSMGIGVAQYDIASAFTRLGTDAFRPRMYVGAQLGRSESESLLMQSYLGAGASLHPARGFAVHVFTGPQALMVEDYGADLAYRGLGWFVRARLYRSFFKSCDVPPSVVAAEMGDEGGGPPVRCRR